jgi:hypothetical protein
VAKGRRVPGGKEEMHQIGTVIRVQVADENLLDPVVRKACPA